MMPSATMRPPELESRVSASVTVLGCDGVGKTALVVRYLTKRYIGDYISGTDMTYKCQLQFMKMKIRIKILDISGDTTKSRIKDLVRFRQSENDVIILVYSVDDHESFRYVSELLPEITNVAPCALLLVIGNKSDLEESRVVFDTDVKLLAARFNFIHMTASAKSSSDDAAQIFAKSINLLFEKRMWQKSNYWESSEGNLVLQPPPRSRRKFAEKREHMLSRRATIEVDISSARRDSHLTDIPERPKASSFRSKKRFTHSSSFTFGNSGYPSTTPISITITPDSDESNHGITPVSELDELPEMPNSAPLLGSKAPVFRFPDIKKKEPRSGSGNVEHKDSKSLPISPINLLSPHLKRNNSFLEKLKEAFTAVPQKLRSPK